MSEANLTIGRLPTELESAASEAVARLRIADLGAWRKFGGQPTDISIFNLASVVLFTDHVAKLEGFADSGAAMERTKFAHLPWWQTSVWLPVAFQPPKEPAIDMGGWPVFLGSCQGLLADLAAVQKISDMSLGTTPDGYDQMRADYRAFMRLGLEMTDERGIIQWVWKGLHDGAELAQRGSALMLDMA
jgi:hypothetical protein